MIDATNQRFRRLEDPAKDFPYYNGLPVSISHRQWVLVMMTVALGFLVLALPIPWPNSAIALFAPAILMPGLPLAALAYVARGHWTAIFGKVGWREVRLMIGFALLNIVVSMGVGVVVHLITDVSSNASTAQLGNLDTAGRMAFYAKTVPQLFGEEVITLLPFLALLTWLTRSAKWSRRAAILGAWVITSVVFGLLHLPTYDWNLIQCVVVIGTARMMLTLPWIMTKNIWVSTGAHVINDWILFSLSLVGVALGVKG